MTANNRVFISIASVALLSATLMGHACTSNAATKTASFTVQARVMSSCQIQWNRFAATPVQLNKECTANIWQLNTAASYDKGTVTASIDF
jgi:hypothetical protein